MKIKGIFIIILSSILLFVPSFLSARDDNQKQIIQKRKDIGKIQKKIEETQRKKQQAQKKEKRTSKELKKISRELKARKRELAIYNWNLEKNKQERESVLSSLNKLTNQHKQLSKCLIEEIRGRFKESLIPQLLIVPTDLGKLTFHSSLDNIVDSHLTLFGERLNEKISSKEAEKGELKKYWELEIAYKKTARKKEKEAKRLSKKKKKLVSRYQKETKEQDKTLKELREQLLSLGRLVKRLEKEQRLTRDFRAGYLRKHKGKLLMPTSGTLVKARYGDSVDIYKGIIIKAPRGRDVVSVANGKVIYADWFRGFGNIAIIEHGGGYTSLYAHLDDILVKTGEKVGEGQVIGQVGDTGSLTRDPRLYFEIRRHGESLNPLEWLGR